MSSWIEAGTAAMCYVIYGALILTLAVYSDALIGQYALSIAAGEDQWTMVALGWELVLTLWPLFALIALAASALTWIIARHWINPAPGAKGGD